MPGADRFDINLVATAQRKKKLLIADMDFTIINVRCLDELADMAGLKPQIAAITERAMRGALEFEAALRERVGMLKGLKLDALDRTYAERVRLNPGMKHLLATMRAQRRPHHAGLRRLRLLHPPRRERPRASMSGAATPCWMTASSLTGEVGTPMLGREAKLAALEEAVAKLGISFADSLAVGDGANDLGMIPEGQRERRSRRRPITPSRWWRRRPARQSSALT